MPAYPVFGIESKSEAALQAQHSDGNLSLELVVTGVEQREDAAATYLEITQKDKVYPFRVKSVYKAYKESDVIEVWNEISHQEPGDVRLQQFASSFLPVRKNDVWISYLNGTWANESKLFTEPLMPGMKVIKNKDGVRNSHTDHAEVMISLDGKPHEDNGRVIGAALCWSGNYRLRFDTGDTNWHSFFAGINEDASDYLLAPGEIFVTPEVQEFIYKLIDDLLTSHPQIAYIKWDANMNINNYGSHHLPAERQSHLYFDYHRGFAKVMQRIRDKYPDMVIQACASGGGRANYGVLPYFDEFWVSDNTEALQRIYMQWGISYFFPAVAMAAHVGSSPNHQTGRVIPLKLRFDVAMTGRLGMEMQPRNMTDEERAFSRKAISNYKEIREVVQQGDLYRLVSPYDDKGVASLLYTDPGKAKAVFFVFKTEHFHGQVLPPLRMAGLDPGKNYRIRELNRSNSEHLPVEGKVISGALLMNNGIELPLEKEYASRVLLLTEVEGVN